MNTLAPDSVAAPWSLGEWISMKSFLTRNSRNKEPTADWILKIDRLVSVCGKEKRDGCQPWTEGKIPDEPSERGRLTRRSMTRLSSLFLSETLTNVVSSFSWSAAERDASAYVMGRTVAASTTVWIWYKRMKR